MLALRICQVSILFLVDATGSMKKKIDTVKDNFIGIVEGVRAEHRNVKTISTAVIAYRDLDQGENHFDLLDFTEDMATFTAFLKG